MSRQPVFSLVLCSLGRTREVTRLLESLCDQGEADFEVILVDQNRDDRLSRVVAPFTSRLDIRHVCSKPGLSRARNVGLHFVLGSIVAFPDDDCWYPPNLLNSVEAQFDQDAGAGVICGLAADQEGNLVLKQASRSPVSLNRYNVWDLAISFTLFMKAAVTQRVGEFDVRLGVGAGTPYGSGEETDYLIRAMADGFRAEYRPSLVVHHPVVHSADGARNLAKVSSYGIGMGFVLNKHRYPTWFRSWTVMRPLIGAVVALMTGRFGEMRMRWQRAIARARGVTMN
jgi:glycosyltransferase involved in cell wall biosynthesis